MRHARWSLLLVLAACSPAVTPPAQVVVPGGADPACADGVDVVDATTLAAALGDAAAGVVRLAPGTYGAVRLARPVTLLGLGTDGACAPPAGADGPLLTSLEVADGAAGSVVSGFRVGGPVVVAAEAAVRRLTVWGAETCVTARAGAHLSELLVSRCGTGVVLSEGASLSGSLVALQRGDGVQLDGPSSLDRVTVADNGGAGVRARGGGQELYNLVVSGNRDWGLYETDPWRFGESVLLHDNTPGHYGSDAPALAFPQAWYTDDVLAAPQVLPGDRYSTEPMMREGGLRAVARTLEPPWAGLPADWPAGAALDLATAQAAWAPQEPLRAAWVRDGTVDGPRVSGTDLAGRALAPDARIGAFESSFTPAEPPPPLLVTPEGDDGGDGSHDRPLGSIGVAVERSLPGQTIQVATGTYAEVLSLVGREVSLQGVKAGEGGWVPVTEADDPAMPVIDAGRTSANQHGILVLGVSQGSFLRGLEVRGAVNGLVVTAGDEDPQRAPRLEALRLQGNRVGLMVLGGRGSLVDSRVADDTIGVWIQGVVGWRFEGNVFADNGMDFELPATVVSGDEDLAIVRNTFDRSGGVYVDNLMGRDARGVVVDDNTLVGTSVTVGQAEPGSWVRVAGNRLSEGGAIRLAGAAWATPRLEVRDNVGGQLEAPGRGWASTQLAQPLVHVPAEDGPPVDPAFPSDARQVQPHSVPIVAHPTQPRVYAVAPEHGVVGEFALDAGLQRVRVFETGPDPRGVALTPDGGTLIVAGFGDGTLAFVDLASGGVETMPVGSEPFGVVVAPDGSRAWVSLSGDDAVVEIDLATRQEVARVQGLGPAPRGLGLADGKLLVTHFLPGRHPGAAPGTLAELENHVSVVDVPGLENPRRIDLPPVHSPWFPPVMPVQVGAVVVRGNRAYLPSAAAFPDAPERYTASDRVLPKFLAATHGVLTVIDVDGERVIPEEGGNLGMPGQLASVPTHVAFAPDDDLAYVAMGGNDQVQQLRLHPGEPPVHLRPWRASMDLLVGTDPRGVVLDVARNQVITVNVGNGTLSATDLDRALVTRVSRLGPSERDPLSDEARHGRQLFSSTNTAEGTSGFAMACASCHPDGRTDGVTWRFAAGPRSTPHLAGSPDTLPLHYDADRDEVADFEHTVRELQGGLGFILEGAIPGELERQDYEGPDAETWDHVTAFLREGVTVAAPPSPTGREEAGAAVFQALGCGTCHGGPWFTTSHLADPPTRRGRQLVDSLVDVGTKQAHDMLGDGAFDPPSLFGLAQSAPYLHDGTAPTLEAVLANRRHTLAGAPSGTSMPSAGAVGDLVAYLRGLGAEAPAYERRRDDGLR
ncbi:MAG: DUF1565 domain-containing protein [Alphaproteobacteria bacterium]|nr:DUF1565 domain-containing protein [Alphaproteobacteria bacterium]